MTRASRAWPAKLMRYGVTGGLAAIVDLGGFVGLVALGMFLPVAAILSFFVATLVNYGLSARFVFGSGPSIRSYLRFLLFAGFGLIINVASTILADFAGLPPALAKLVGIAVAFGINFLFNLVYVFPHKEKPAAHPETGSDR
mgnify:CR=1 FL=1